MRKISIFFSVLIIIPLFYSHLSFAVERFQPRGCEFSVEFPAKPKIIEVIIPGLGTVENAEYVKGETPKDTVMLIVEGYPIPENAPIFSDPKKYLLDGAQNYATSNGIQNAEFKFLEDKLGVGILMRGYKNLNGVPAIYSSMTVVGKSSIISLRVGAAAEIYPPKEVTDFFKSLK